MATHEALGQTSPAEQLQSTLETLVPAEAPREPGFQFPLTIPSDGELITAGDITVSILDDGSTGLEPIVRHLAENRTETHYLIPDISHNSLQLLTHVAATSMSAHAARTPRGLALLMATTDSRASSGDQASPAHRKQQQLSGEQLSRFFAWLGIAEPIEDRR